jgi:hypothetical protein
MEELAEADVPGVLFFYVRILPDATGAIRNWRTYHDRRSFVEIVLLEKKGRTNKFHGFFQ